MCGWCYGDEGFSSLAVLHLLINNFRNANGAMPKDSGELLAWLWRNKTDEADRVSHLPTEQQYVELASLINPVTGRFFESFEATEWTPGGVWLRQLNSIDEVYDAFGDRPGAERALLTAVKSTWLITLWGDTPKERLGDHPLVIETADSIKAKP
jgi:hypothetical protein